MLQTSFNIDTALHHSRSWLHRAFGIRSEQHYLIGRAKIVSSGKMWSARDEASATRSPRVILSAEVMLLAAVVVVTMGHSHMSAVAVKAVRVA